MNKKLVSLVAAVFMFATNAGAVDFSGKTVEWLIPFSPGGGSDKWSRFYAPMLSKALPGNPNVVVNNCPGGGGTTCTNKFSTMKKKCLGLIPVRLHSSRLMLKSLLLIKKIPLIIHTYRRAKLSKKLDELIICCDDKKIFDIAKKYNAKAILTSKKHKNGTERIYEAYTKIKKKI